MVPAGDLHPYRGTKGTRNDGYGKYTRLPLFKRKSL